MRREGLNFFLPNFFLPNFFAPFARGGGLSAAAEGAAGAAEKISQKKCARSDKKRALLCYTGRGAGGRRTGGRGRQKNKGDSHMDILQTILVGVAAIVVLAIVLKLLKFSVKTILKFAINAVIGIALIFLLRLIPGVDIPITWWTGLVSGLFGVPGVIVLLILSFFLF